MFASWQYGQALLKFKLEKEGKKEQPKNNFKMRKQSSNKSNELELTSKSLESE